MEMEADAVSGMETQLLWPSLCLLCDSTSVSRECKKYWETWDLIQHFCKLFKLNPPKRKMELYMFIFFLQRVSIFNEPDLWNQLSLYIKDAGGRVWGS